MRIPTGEIRFDLGNLSKILADEKLLVTNVFPCIVVGAPPGRKEKVTRSVLPVAQPQIKASLHRMRLCRA